MDQFLFYYCDFLKIDYNTINRVAQSCKALGTSWGLCLSFLLIKEIHVMALKQPIGFKEQVQKLVSHGIFRGRRAEGREDTEMH